MPVQTGMLSSNSRTPSPLLHSRLESQSRQVRHNSNPVVRVHRSDFRPSERCIEYHSQKQGENCKYCKYVPQYTIPVCSVLAESSGSSRLAGQLIKWGRFHLRPIQLFFLDMWRPSTGSPQDLILIPQSLRPKIAWWSVEMNLMKGVPLESPPVEIRLFTDASTKGWGAHLDGQNVQGSWTVQESALHINLLEMRAVKQALVAFQIPVNSSILISTDNSTVVSYINHQGGTRSKSLWIETIPLFHLAISKNWTICARHIPGKLNVIADQN